MKIAIENKIQWFEATLNDVCVKITDGAHLSPKSVANGMPMASVKDLTSYGINIDSCRQITKEDYDKLVRQGCQPLEGDVLIAKDGATALDTVCVVKKTSEVVLLSSVAILRPDREKIDSLFLRYYLDSETTRSYMKGAYTTGAAIPRVVLKDFKLASIKFASLPIQRKIAAILSAYDDLIENNLRRIKILEEMAQNLYREWFVKFRFPGHEQARFVDSPLGRIPEEWEVKKLGEILGLKYGKALKQENRREGNVPVYGSSGVVGYHDVHLVNGPGIVIGRKGNVGSVYWSEKSFYPIDTAYFVSSEMPLRFLFYDLQTKNFLNNDAAVPGLNRNQAYSLETVIPPEDILLQFCCFADDFEQQAALLRIKNTTLRRTRDMLLPRLISGEVNVSELDIAIPEEAVA